MNTAVKAADLRPVDLFDELDDQELAEWAAAANWREVDAGGIVIDTGKEPEGTLCLLEGTLQIFRPDGDRLEPVGNQVAPTWIGAVPTITETPMAVRMVATTPARLAIIAAVEFRRLAHKYPTVHSRVMRQVRPLMARMTAFEQRNERLAALGTMAAGLAHELNNPAAAARSSAGQLAMALDDIGATVRQFTEAGVEREDAARIADLREQALRQVGAREQLSGLAAADAEDEMRDRLEELGVTEASRLAEPLALAGVDADWLEQLHAAAGRATSAALRSIAASIDAKKLVTELCESTQRMTALVGAVKAYAYMDRGGLVKADIHEGLETTLTILHHKLKHTEIEIQREYDRTLPPLTIYGSELNQVWTNLIVNAIEALGSSGTITLRTRRDGECAVVEVSDDGPGIPEEARDHLFEPFFTTKAVGQGTGLGLDTAKRIVEERHRGTLRFETGQHGSTFSVWLPIDQTEGGT
jgi:signal transduction histidine kinase